MTGRPAELWQAIVAIITGAALNIYGFALDEVESIVPQIAGVLVAAVGFVASLVTKFVASRQRDPNDSTTSSPDGTVVTP